MNTSSSQSQFHHPVDANSRRTEIDKPEELSSNLHPRFDEEMSTSSAGQSVFDKKPTRFSRRLEELKKQQAKLDKIKSEKDQLQAFLNYQAEMEKEKERKLQEEMHRREILYNQKAVVIQKYARVWLAKRVLVALQEQEYQKQKALLSQALEEMRDQIRV